MDPVVRRRDRLSSGYIRVDRLTIRLAGGAEVVREVETHGHAVAILPYDPVRRRALVVRLFRAPPFDVCGLTELEEACAGMIDDTDADAETAVRREAEEELGLAVGDLEFVARIWPSPGISTETATLFLASYSPEDRTGTGGGLASENEDITVVERSLTDLAEDADAGRIADGKLLTLVLALRVRRPDLFAV
jgi:nudix-type nucleoside diphosphatase (YffH/AdpP family)